MVWVFLGGFAALMLLHLAVQVLGGPYEYRQMQRRTRQHRETGGKLGEAPDIIPPHGRDRRTDGF